MGIRVGNFEFYLLETEMQKGISEGLSWGATCTTYFFANADV